MTNKQGDFIWYELMTTDADAAQRFYGAVIGWTFLPPLPGGMDYRHFKAGEHGIGGVLPLTKDMISHGARPTWMGYIAVEDVEARIEAIKGAGGQVLMPPMDVEGAGRIAMVTDPQGAPFYIIAPKGEGQSLAFAFDRPRPGHIAWNELITSDRDAAWAFYGGQFGWAKEGEIEIPSIGAYEFIRHGFMLGAMMKGTDQMGPPHWNFYIRVPDIDAAKATVEGSGGTIIHRHDGITGGDFILNGIDPQGAHFSLVGARK